MITPSHIIYNWAAARALDGQMGQDPIRTKAAIIGGFLPDTPTYILFFVQTFVMGTSQQELWSSVYFDSAWTPVITLSHSFLLWPAVIILGYLLQKHFMMWLGAGSFFHSFMDFFVHNDDAYRHFWPLSDWKFESPISYWDPEHYGSLVSGADTVIVMLLLLFIMKKMTTKRMRHMVGAIGFIYLLMTLLPYLIFS